MSDFEHIPNEEMEEEVPGAEAQDDNNIVEELTVAGNQLVREVERLINEGNVRRLIIKQDDRVLLEVSLTLGVVGAGALAIFAPVPAVLLAAVAALAAAVSKVTIEIERSEEGNDLELPPADEEE
ncbi:MAG: hypothetical protein Kow0077_31290 [Anaerolineae bacterium]